MGCRGALTPPAAAARGAARGRTGTREALAGGALRSDRQPDHPAVERCRRPGGRRGGAAAGDGGGAQPGLAPG